MECYIGTWCGKYPFGWEIVGFIISHFAAKKHKLPPDMLPSLPGNECLEIKKSLSFLPGHHEYTKVGGMDQGDN